MMAPLVVIIGVATACSDPGPPLDDPGPHTTPATETTPTTTTTEATAEVGEAIYRVIAKSCEADGLALATAVGVGEDLVVTVAHALERVASVEIEDKNGHRRSVEVAWLDPSHDIALLQLPTKTDSWLTLGPAIKGDTATIFSIADRSRETDEHEVVVETQPTEILRELTITVDGSGARAGFELVGDIDPGDSGSPVVNPDGQLIGMVFGSNPSADRGWAVAAKEIEAALAQREGGPVSLEC